ncbi:MAG TPA: KH domain-containing protein [bacterium]|nr:KH domain-containing protein [bacterium]
MAEADQNFVEDVVKAIVDNPDDVKTDRTIDERGVLIKLYVNPEDMGKIIGKDGKTAKAIRTLLRVFGAKSNARLNLKIVEPEGSERSFDDDDQNNHQDRQEEPEQEESEEKSKALDDIPNDVLA